MESFLKFTSRDDNFAFRETVHLKATTAMEARLRIGLQCIQDDQESKAGVFSSSWPCLKSLSAQNNVAVYKQ